MAYEFIAKPRKGTNPHPPEANPLIPKTRFTVKVNLIILKRIPSPMKLLGNRP